jgi:hypothetical protein
LFKHHTLHNPVHMPHSAAWFGTYLSGFPWQAVVIGILAGLVVHRVYAPAGNTVQLYFIGRSVDRTRDAQAAGEENPYRHLPRWPWPPIIRERAAWIMNNNLPVPDRTRDIRSAVRVVTVILVALAIYGAYVRYVVAKGHGLSAVRPGRWWSGEVGPSGGHGPPEPAAGAGFLEFPIRFYGF